MGEMDDALSDVESKIISRAGEGVRAFFDDQVQAGLDHLEGVDPPTVGSRAPDFELVGSDGQVSLDQLVSHGPAVLLFLRGHW